MDTPRARHTSSMTHLESPRAHLEHGHTLVTTHLEHNTARVTLSTAHGLTRPLGGRRAHACLGLHLAALAALAALGARPVLGAPHSSYTESSPQL